MWCVAAGRGGRREPQATAYTQLLACCLCTPTAEEGRGPGVDHGAEHNHEATSAFTTVKQTKQSPVYTFIVCPVALVAPLRCLEIASYVRAF